MATVIWCDRAMHVVQPDVASVNAWLAEEADEFIPFRLVPNPNASSPGPPMDVYLRRSAITSFHAFEGAA